MRVLTTILLFLFMIGGVNASELGFKFHSPSFSGAGKSHGVPEKTPRPHTGVSEALFRKWEGKRREANPEMVFEQGGTVVLIFDDVDGFSTDFAVAYR